jgi:hypothetical protein
VAGAEITPTEAADRLAIRELSGLPGKRENRHICGGFLASGPRDGTSDLSAPSRMRYQTAPRPRMSLAGDLPVRRPTRRRSPVAVWSETSNTPFVDMASICAIGCLANRFGAAAAGCRQDPGTPLYSPRGTPSTPSRTSRRATSAPRTPSGNPPVSMVYAAGMRPCTGWACPGVPGQRTSWKS